jgi:tetratricopeptide (TPR) repeat protein
MNFIRRSFFILIVVISSFTCAFSQYNDPSSDFSYAIKLYNQNFYDLAAQQFVKYYTTYPQNENTDEAKFYAGMSLFLLKEYNKSRIEFQSLALEFPKSKRAGESWFKIGECYELLENYPEAAKSFETLKNLYPQDHLAAQALYRAGDNYIKSKEYTKAKSVYAGILDRYPESPVYYKAMVQLATVSNDLNDSEQAKFYLNKVIQNSKESSELAQAYYTIGLIDFERGYNVSARASLLKVVKDYSGTEYQPLASINLAKISIQNNKYADAIDYLEKTDLSSLSEKRINEILVLKGDAFYLNGKFALAEKSYETVRSRIDKNDSLFVLTSLKKALAQKKQGLTGKALTSLEELYKMKSNDPLSVEISKIYSDWLDESGKTAESIAIILQLLKSDIDNENRLYFVYKLAVLNSSIDRWRDVIRDITPYINSTTITKYKDDFLFYLANAHQKLGEYDESAYYYDMIIKQYSASKYYQQASEAYAQLVDYFIVDHVQVSRNQMAVLSSLSDDNNRSEFPLMLGKIYYNDLKDYVSAQKEFEKAITTSKKKGDSYLFLGKSLLKLAYQPGGNAAKSDQFLKMASDNFQNAVANIATCSDPDEASWLMVQTGVSVDTTSTRKLKKYIETLIAKYPNSTLKEEWMRTLAHDLAFSEIYAEDSKTYFRELITNYKRSEKYPSYLYGYAKLIRDSDPESAIKIFKTLALDYVASPNAAPSLQEIAAYYEDKGQYKEAAQLYSRLLDQFYYSEIAENTQDKIGELNLKAGNNNETVALLSDKVNHPFIEDIVLSGEFLRADFKNNLAYLGIAYKRLDEKDQAVKYLKKFLTLSSSETIKNMVSFELAELYFNDNHTSLALEYFKNVSKSDPKLYNESLLYQADILYSSNDYQQAARAYDELRAIFKGESQEKDINGKFILCKIKNGEISLSEKLINEYKKNFPKAENYFASFVIELGEYHRRNKNFDAALKNYKTVESKYDDSEYVDDANYYKALTYITLNKNKEAFDILTNFYQKFQNSDKLPYVLNSLGSLYFRVEKYDNAISSFKNALNKSKEPELSRQIMSNLINTYKMTGFWDAAQGLARQYVEQYPNAEDRLDKKMIIAQAFINLSQFENAAEYLKRMKLEADSESEPEIQFYIGEAYLKAGQYEQAIAEFVKIPLLSKKTKLQWEASALYYSGQAYEKLGRISDAVRMYKEIISRPGIDLILKKDAEKRISQIQG